MPPKYPITFPYIPLLIAHALITFKNIIYTFVRLHLLKYSLTFKPFNVLFDFSSIGSL